MHEFFLFSDLKHKPTSSSIGMAKAPPFQRVAAAAAAAHGDDQDEPHVEVVPFECDERRIFFRHDMCDNLQEGKGLFVSALDRYQNVTIVVDAPPSFPEEVFMRNENGDIASCGLKFLCGYLIKIRKSSNICDNFFPGDDQVRACKKIPCDCTEIYVFDVF